MPVMITARREGFRRLGIAHSAKTTTYPDDHFTPAQLVVLENDPNLIVLRTDSAQGSESDEALVKASARIAELEAGITQLSNDADKLKSTNNMLMDLRDEQKRRIDEQDAEIMALTAERDELQAKLSAVASAPVQDNEPAKAQEADKPATNGRKKG